MTYKRVLPRDLFNEAKLLKCAGHLCLAILQDEPPSKMSHNEMKGPFKIELLPEGSLFISNLHFILNGKEFLFKTTYNSKSNYPFYMEFEYCDYLVFDENGDFDKEFIEICENLNKSITL